MINNEPNLDVTVNKFFFNINYSNEEGTGFGHRPPTEEERIEEFSFVFNNRNSETFSHELVAKILGSDDEFSKAVYDRIVGHYTTESLRTISAPQNITYTPIIEIDEDAE